MLGYGVYHILEGGTVPVVAGYGEDDFRNGAFFEFFLEEFCCFRWILSKDSATEGTEDENLCILFRCNPVDEADPFFQCFFVFCFCGLSVTKCDALVG